MAEAEAPKNMPLPLPVCFKVAVQILVDACRLEILLAQYSSEFIQIIFVYRK
jgi:hypothetical protein